MKITQDNNFCRVFELPAIYPEEFCFNGGHVVEFIMVDWFNPVNPIDLWNGGEVEWEQIRPEIECFLKEKNYLKSGRRYLVITDFGESFVFEKGEQKNEP